MQLGEEQLTQGLSLKRPELKNVQTLMYQTLQRQKPRTGSDNPTSNSHPLTVYPVSLPDVSSAIFLSLSRSSSRPLLEWPSSSQLPNTSRTAPTTPPFCPPFFSSARFCCLSLTNQVTSVSSQPSSKRADISFNSNPRCAAGLLLTVTHIQTSPVVQNQTVLGLVPF